MRNTAGIRCQVCGYRIGRYSPYRTWGKLVEGVFKHVTCKYRVRQQVIEAAELADRAPIP